MTASSLFASVKTKLCRLQNVTNLMLIEILKTFKRVVHLADILAAVPFLVHQ